MTATIDWWDHTSLGPGPLTLAVFPQGRADGQKWPALSAASNGERCVALLPNDLGTFLRRHADAVVVCHDAAALHWLLHDFLVGTNDQESLDALWRLSRDCRLIDVQILDQHVRRFGGQDASEGLSLSVLTHRYTQESIAEDQEIHAQIAAAWAHMGQQSASSILDLVARASMAMMRVYRQLEVEADKIMSFVERANPPNVYALPSPEVQEEIAAKTRQLLAGIMERRQAESNNAGGRTIKVDRELRESPEEIKQARPSTRGPLGVGIDVQGTIAMKRLVSHQQQHVELQRLRDIQDAGERLYREASVRLRGDHEARRCFKWDQDLVARDEAGEPISYRDKLKDWLQRLAERFVDCHGWPSTASVPRNPAGELVPDPEKWDIWVDCNRGLSAWRDLQIAAAMIRLQAADQHQSWPRCQVVPLIRYRPPSLCAVQNVIGSIIQPRTGNVYLLVRLHDLRVRCFAALCRRSGYSFNGRLHGYLLHTENPIETAAAELYLRVLNSQRRNTATTEDEDAGGRFGCAVEAFRDCQRTSPEDQTHWLGLTRALLETMPLGLAPSLLGVYLEQVHGGELAEADLMTVTDILKNQVADEVAGYLDDDVLDRIARQLRMPVTEVIDRVYPQQHSETLNASLRNDLRDRRRGRPLWDLICSIDAAEGAPEEVAERALFRATYTLAGRVTPRAYPMETRRLEYLHAVDEVMKAVAFALVAAGYGLIAVGEETLVVEIAEDTTKEEMTRIGRLAQETATKLLGKHLAPPCSVEI